MEKEGEGERESGNERERQEKEMEKEGEGERERSLKGERMCVIVCSVWHNIPGNEERKHYASTL
jgi:hypothetical protein